MSMLSSSMMAQLVEFIKTCLNLWLDSINA